MGVWRESVEEVIRDLISRKFIVFGIATALLWFKSIESQIWLYVALGYLSSNLLDHYISNRR